MPQVLLKFNSDEKAEADLCLKAGDMACCLTDIRNLFRSHYKYNSITPDFGTTREEYITRAYEAVCELISEYELGNVV